jgi:hypothetical protein
MPAAHQNGSKRHRAEAEREVESDGAGARGIVSLQHLKKARLTYEKAAEMLEDEDAGDTESVVKHLQQVVNLLMPNKQHEEPTTTLVHNHDIGGEEEDHGESEDADEEESTESEARALGATASCLLAKIRYAL